MNKIKHQCPSGFEFSKDGSCYRLDMEKVTWGVAKMRCEALASHLVAIESRQEQRFIMDSVKSTPSKLT